MIRNPMAPYHIWLVIVGGMALWQSNCDVTAVVIFSLMGWLFWRYDKMWRSF